MLIKASLLGCALLSTPFCFAAATPGGAPQDKPHAAKATDAERPVAPRQVLPRPVAPKPVTVDVEELQRKLREMEAAVERAKSAADAADERARAATQRASQLQVELN
ncbi:MAG: hypothetical protein GY953_37280, partial [bacterium]|nr:hypothetical protein [bacterium]